MSVLDTIALGAAERVAESLGPRAGLRAFEALSASATESVRARALLGAIRCAGASDEGAVARLCRAWRTQRGDHFVGVSHTCRTLLRLERPALALRLADAEVERSPEDARAWYLRARCGSSNARDDLRRALRFARRPPRQLDVEASAAARLARITGEDVELMEAPLVDARDRLALVAARLNAKGRYRRVMALDELAELADSKEPVVRDTAIQLAARHADADTRVTDIERDRIAVVLARWPHLEQRRIALLRLAGSTEDPEMRSAERSAEAVLTRYAAGPPPSPPTVTWRAQETVAAFCRGDDSRRDLAAALCEQLRDVPAAAITAPVLTAGWLCLRDDDEALRALGEELASLAARGAHPVARRGWARLAEQVDDPVVADLLLQRGHSVHEPDAARRLAESATRAAWASHRRGDSAQALAALRRAKRLASTP